MADSLTPEKRSWNMSKIKSRDTSIELKVRRFLFNKGFRYRVNVKNLPGKPDIVLQKYNTVIFIHGCFWHRHENCKNATIAKTRTDFWIEKFRKNVENDNRHTQMLLEQGWKVIILCECKIEKNFENTLQNLISTLKLE